MSELLQVLKDKEDYDHAGRDHADHHLLVQEKDEMTKPPGSDSDYFSIFDTFPRTDDSSGSREDENYESLENNYMLSFFEPFTTYELMESHTIENVFIQSTKYATPYAEDIIFTLIDNSKRFEFGAIALSSGIAVSMLALPEGFGLGVSFLLGAPLVVCVAGICIKLHKRRT